MNEFSTQQFTTLTKKLNHTFKNIDLLAQALRHRSVGTLHNERLEFLGDSILGFVISSELYCRHRDAQEGELSRMRSSLVNGSVLAKLALDFSVNEYLQLGVGEKKNGGAQRESILADAMEAIIGAIYLDAGIDSVRDCIVEWYGERVDNLSSLKSEKDPKSQLQEWVQAHQYPLPEYEVSMSGKAHELTFKIVCTVQGLSHSTTGQSTSRRKAEQIAAQHYLDLLDEQRK